MANADETAVATSREMAITSPEQALREILGVISQSRDDETPVFDVILRNATELCGADSASIVLGAEGDAAQRMVAQRGVNPGTIARYDSGAYTMDREQSLAAEAILDGRTIHVPDMAATEKYLKGDENFRSVVDDTGIRTNLFVPLMAAVGGIGALILFRKDVRPYSEDEIALVEAFAAQAVIAIENVHQFRDLQNRLEREAATSEVLGVISSSKDDESPVFDVILQNAARLCRAKVARLSVVNEKRNALKFAAQVGMVSEGMVPGVTEWPLDGTQGIAVAVRTGEIQHIPDYVGTDLYREGDQTRVMLVERDGLRSALVVPLLAAGGPIGVIAIHRETAGPFSDDEISLVRTFAAQAVIAIENVRQFRELQTRLERERASREVLDVISTSRENDIPVFETILRNASRICNAPIAFLSLADEGRTEVRIPAHRGTRSKFGGILEGFVEPITRTELVAVRPVATGETVLEDDIKDDEAYRTGDPRRRQMVDVEGARSVLAVPLIRDGEPIGAIVLYKREVAPFSEDDLTLVQNFAAQAVIAIENVRQFRELQNRLEREKATGEILSVISRSRDDERPVFRKILQKAVEFCGADLAGLNLLNDDRTKLDLVEVFGGRDAGPFNPGDYQTDMRDADNNMVACVAQGRTIAVADLADSDGYRSGANVQRVAMVDEIGVRSWLSIPLLQDGVAIGCFVLSRTRVSPFTDNDITLVETFAAQAVIAIENVRQFREVQERLEREAASAEILEVISRSRDDDQPVFDVIVETVSRLCAAPLAYLCVLNEERTHVSIPAMTGTRPEFAAALGRFNESVENDFLFAVKSSMDCEVIRFDDLADSDLYRSGNEYRVKMVDEEGMRSVLSVPLESDGVGYGCIVLYRREVSPFTDEDVKLVRNFAAQAVIAIQNVRQFKALETLNAELGDRVQEQVGEIERMGRLKRFLPSQVADAVVSKGDDILSSHRALIATLFCDIRGFTAFCERAEPEETIEVLQTYHEEMGRLLSEYGAGVEHRMGDGIMAIFNDPLPCDDPAGDALRLAIAMRARMEELCKGWKRLGHRLGFGVGISLGYATVGMVGSEGRYEYTASGTSVNLAARLCDHAENGEILLSPRAVTAVEDDFMIEPHGELSLKGIREPVPVHRAVSARS